MARRVSVKPRDDADMAASLIRKPPPKTKYHNQRTEFDGITYDSKAEAARAAELAALKQSGAVRLVLRQPRFTLGDPENVYVPDFLVWGAHGNVRVEDVKGVETAKFARDKKLWRRFGQCPLWILHRGKTEVILPEGFSDGGDS